MDDLTERERKERARVEDALRTYPLADTPPDFAGRVMHRVQAEAPTARFRVSWLEALISLVVPGMGMLLLVAWSSLPPQAVAYLQTRAVLFWQFIQRAGLGWVLPAGGLTIVGLFIGMTVRLLRPAYRRSRVIRINP
jgi:hypothetical protein